MGIRERMLKLNNSVSNNEPRNNGSLFPPLN